MIRSTHLYLLLLYSFISFLNIFLDLWAKFVFYFYLPTFNSIDGSKIDLLCLVICPKDESGLSQMSHFSSGNSLIAIIIIIMMHYICNALFGKWRFIEKLYRSFNNVFFIKLSYSLTNVTYSPSDVTSLGSFSMLRICRSNFSIYFFCFVFL